MSLEKQLEQLKNVTIKPENPSFKGNLRKRLINEHMTMFDTKPSQDSMKDSRTWFDRVLLPLKMQSAFNLAVLFISSFLLVSVSAAYITGPDDLSTRIVNTLTNKESIRIFSNIEGATVYINGQSKGITPVTVGLSEGNYSLRLEKSGYGIYSDTLRISKEGEHEVFAQLLKHASENDTYAGWLNYNNEELDFAFNYPPDWQIQEKLTSESDRIDNLTVMVSDGEHGVTFTFNSTEDFELDTRADVASYKRDLEFNSFKQSRFIQFESDGNFITAGMTIDTDDSVPFSIAYRMQGTEQEVLSSSILKTLDNISSSLVIGEYDPSQVIASSAEDENENIKV
ncbi:PEGA domain-containing protein, partial [Candidatus Dojkabacteria bacterium]|nr:PEGA domain-containing protein [Candidatus Dojkabacteria bacterium]